MRIPQHPRKGGGERQSGACGGQSCGLLRERQQVNLAFVPLKKEVFLHSEVVQPHRLGRRDPVSLPTRWAWAEFREERGGEAAGLTDGSLGFPDNSNPYPPVRVKVTSEIWVRTNVHGYLSAAGVLPPGADRASTEPSMLGTPRLYRHVTLVGDGGGGDQNRVKAGLVAWSGSWGL